jgi:F-type H+-transporting ATPase subunit a
MDDQLTQAFGGKKEGRAFFPFVMTLLLFIALANQLSLFPILFQVLVEGKPLMRLATSDLSETLTLGLLVVLLSHVLALIVSPIRHIGGYFRFGALLKVRSLKDLGGALIEVFLGLMDIIGEFAKIVSISCRLFGNLFAGDVMVAVIISLSTFTQFLVPIPFIFLGLFSGIVQAFVFTLLTIQFLAGPVNSARAHREEREQAKREASSAESVGVAV